MQNWHIFGLFSASIAVALALAAFFSWWARKEFMRVWENEKTLQNSISALENVLKEEEEAEHLRLSEQGKKGVEVREQNKEMRQAAMAEGRAIIAAPGSLDDKKQALIALAAKYPLVAEQAAKGLIREFGLQPYEPVIMQLVSAEVQKALQGGQGQQAPSEFLGFPDY